MVDISKFKTAKEGIEYIKSEEFRALDNATKVEQIKQITRQLPTVAPGQTVMGYSGTIPIHGQKEAGKPIALSVSKERSMGFVNEKKGIKDSSKWRTVDYKRNLVLRNTDRSLKNHVESFELSVGEATLAFGTRVSREFHEDGRSSITYEINAINLPLSLSNRKAEILQYIGEALEAFGTLYDRERLRDVHVTLSRNLQKTFSQ